MGKKERELLQGQVIMIFVYSLHVCECVRAARYLEIFCPEISLCGSCFECKQLLL